jgi:hypothetical protein
MPLVYPTPTSRAIARAPVTAASMYRVAALLLIADVLRLSCVLTRSHAPYFFHDTKYPVPYRGNQSRLSWLGSAVDRHTVA